MPDAERKMLALRAGEAVSIMVEQARIDGPDAVRRAPGEPVSPCIQLGSFIHDDEAGLSRGTRSGACPP